MLLVCSECIYLFNWNPRPLSTCALVCRSLFYMLGYGIVLRWLSLVVGAFEDIGFSRKFIRRW